MEEALPQDHRLFIRTQYKNAIGTAIINKIHQSLHLFRMNYASFDDIPADVVETLVSSERET